MAKRPNYDDLAGYKPPTQRRTEDQVAKLLSDMTRIDSVVATGNFEQLKALHVELDGTYQNRIKNWGTSMYNYINGMGFTYDYICDESLRDNLMTMKGKLQGLLFEIDPGAESQADNSEDSEYSSRGRKNIYEIMHSAGISLKTEYERLYSLFHDNKLLVGDSWISIYQISEDACVYFDLAFTNRAVSLKEIEKAFGYNYSRSPCSITIEYVISFCELLINLCYQLNKLFSDEEIDKEYLDVVIRNTDDCMDKFGYFRMEHNGVFIYTEKKPEAIAVAEIVDDSLSYRVLEYNHIRMRGNLKGKLSILKLMADDIENKQVRNAIKSINTTFESQLYQLINKFVRHDHSQTQIIADMQDEELEMWYDEIYQMWLLAKLGLDHLDRKKRVAALLQQING